MPWDRPNPNEWCTRNGRVVIERAFCSTGFEIRHRINRGRYRWVQDCENEVRLFKTLIEAKSFARRELLLEEAV